MTNFRENHGIPAIYGRFAIRVTALVTIATAQVAGAQLVDSADVDTEVLSAILKAEVSEARWADLLVDPRPLLADAVHIYTVGPESIAPVAASVVDRRAAVIRATGLRNVDTTIVNQSRKCPGPFVTRSIENVDDRRTTVCPENPFDVLTIGPARAGSAVLPGGQVYDRITETPARGYWAARVIRTTLGHGRSSAYAADYVLTKRAGAWVVIKVVGLMYAH